TELMASTHMRRGRRDREAVMSPYASPASGWRNPGLLVVPALVVFCFLFGAFYAFSAPLLGAVYAAPLAVLALVVIWAPPAARTAPIKSLAPLTWAFLVVLVMWPPYLGFQVKGTPWITPIRMVGTPLFLVLLICFSTYKQFRAELAETLGA